MVDDDDTHNEDYLISIPGLVTTLCMFMVCIVLVNTFVASILLLRKPLRTVRNLYIIALCISQLLVGTFVIISTMKGINVIETLSTWCLIAPCLELFSFAAGIFFLIGITTDRFRLVIYHASYNPSIRSTVIGILGLAAAAFIYSLRIYVQVAITQFIDSTDNDTTSQLDASNNFCNILTEDESSDLWFRVFDFLMLFVTPITIMTYMYTRIKQKLWAKYMVASASTQKKRKAVIISVVSVMSFFVCWLPFYAIYIIHDTIEIVTEKEVDGSLYDILRYCSIFLALSNSIINPIIYGFLNKNFQREVLILKNLYCCQQNRVGVMKDMQKSQNGGKLVAQSSFNVQGGSGINKDSDTKQEYLSTSKTTLEGEKANNTNKNKDTKQGCLSTSKTSLKVKKGTGINNDSDTK